ncbi:MAG: penicillin-binding protein [Bacteroidetes bacterium]|nr:penicillin-binding protein [Bacteroidota bacterium]
MIKNIFLNIKKRIGNFRFFGKKKEKATPTKWYYRLLKFFLKLFVAVVIYFLAVNFNFLWLFGSSPSVNNEKEIKTSVASELYTADSVLIAKYYKENRSPATYNEIPQVFINALIATEDARFFEHGGIDLRATFSVFWYFAKGDNRGGSTITQQLAKNLYKTRKISTGLFGYIPIVRTIVAKTKEWITAVKLERSYTKQEILTMYINTVDFGSNSYGIKVASQTYFGKHPILLNTEEAALLVGILKAPTLYSPIANPKNALERRNIVLSQMVKYGYLTQEKFDVISKHPIKLNYKQDDQSNIEHGAYLRNAVANFLKDWLKKKGLDLYTDGLKIYTTIDSKMQRYAEEAVAEQMKKLQKKFNRLTKGSVPWTDKYGEEVPHYIENFVKTTDLFKKLQKRYKNHPDSVMMYLNKKKKMTIFSWKGEKDTIFSPIDSIKYYKQFLNAGFMCMDPFNGNVKAWVGGINYKYFKYDHVNQAKRQPGSTFKPFVYLTAIDNGYSPCDRIEDRAVTINYVENGVKKSWSPHNADFEFTGENMTLRHAMARSCNSVTAQLTEKVTPQKVAKYARQLGILSPLKPVPSIGLGSNDVSIYEMVGAYSSFLNKGIRNEPFLITKVADKKGKVIEKFKPVAKRVISEETAFLMVYMMMGGLEEPGGTSQALFEFDIFQKNQIGGKTGTSTSYSDGWFMGMSKDLVCGSWVGGEDRSIHFVGEEGEGCHTALPIYGIFMTKVYNDPSLGITKGYFPKPKIKIVKHYICKSGGKKKDKDDDDNGFFEDIPVEKETP